MTWFISLATVLGYTWQKIVLIQTTKNLLLSDLEKMKNKMMRKLSLFIFCCNERKISVLNISRNSHCILLVYSSIA